MWTIWGDVCKSRDRRRTCSKEVSRRTKQQILVFKPILWSASSIAIWNDFRYQKITVYKSYGWFTSIGNFDVVPQSGVKMFRNSHYENSTAQYDAPAESVTRYDNFKFTTSKGWFAKEWIVERETKWRKEFCFFGLECLVFHMKASRNFYAGLQLRMNRRSNSRDFCKDEIFVSIRIIQTIPNPRYLVTHKRQVRRDLNLNWRCRK